MLQMNDTETREAESTYYIESTVRRAICLQNKKLSTLHREYLYPVQSAKSCCFLIRHNGEGRVNSGKHKTCTEI